MTASGVGGLASRPPRPGAVRGALILLAALVAPAPTASQDLVLTNVRVVDPVGRTVTDGSIWIRDGRVAGVGTSVPEGAPGDRRDLAGAWVIPGLVDMHTHSFGNMAPGGVTDGAGTLDIAERVLRAGVVAFLDLFSVEDYILALRDRQAEGPDAGARILAAGPCITAPGGHCTEYGVPTRVASTPDEARREVAELAPKRPDVVKVVYAQSGSMPSIDRPTLEALLATAQEHGLPTAVHVGTWDDVRDAVRAGATAVTHVPRDGVAPDDVVDLMAERGTFHIPTLVVHTDLAALADDPSLLDTPLFQALASDSLRAVYRRGAGAWGEQGAAWLERQRALEAETPESVKRLHDGGVRMLTGTDAGNLGVVQGYSVHREILRLTEAGLDPFEALAAASTNAGAFFGVPYGVRPGDEAHLVVLEGSPLEDIENTQRIRMVVLEGRVVFER